MASTSNNSPSPNDRDFSDDARVMLERIATVSPSVVYVFNTQTQSGEYTSGSVARLIGYTPEQVNEMGSQFMAHLCHPEDLPRFGQHMARMSSLPASETDDQIERFEYRMKHVNGDWRWFMSNDRVLERDARGNVLRLIGAATDITEAKQAEELAVSQKEAADLLNSRLQLFTQSLAHDLRAPTVTMRLLMSELKHLPSLQADPLACELLGDCVKVVESMDNLLTSVNENLQAATTKLTWETTDLNQLLETTLRNLRGVIEANAAEVQIETLPTLICSQQHLQIVFQNLIENAIKHHGATDSRPSVRVYAETDPITSVTRIAVRDNGPGIPLQYQDRVFLSFHKLERNKTESGSGLGLAISRHIVELHGGELIVNPDYTDGAEFVMTLPTRD